MKKKLLILLTAFIPLFSSCNRDTSELKTICPLGAPSIVFYDQGNNDSFVTTGATATILAQFQRTEYDAIVIDSSSGLKAIKEYNSPYRFAKLLTAGNLYLVTNKSLDLDNIASDKTVLAFGSENSIPFLTFKSIYKSASKITRDDGVSSVAAKALENPDSFDYFVLAEPALTPIKAKYSSTITYKKFDLPDNIIPQAALFINKDSYKNKEVKFTNYINSLNTRIDNSISNINEVTSTLSKYGDESKIKQRFGLPKKEILTKVQSNNGLAIYPSSNKFTYEDMNKFLKAINSSESYSQDYFINI